jgi:hypothetical protein
VKSLFTEKTVLDYDQKMRKDDAKKTVLDAVIH